MLARCTKAQAGLSGRVAAVLGGQWGDEGKGKLADVLAKNYDIVGRFNGHCSKSWWPVKWGMLLLLLFIAASDSAVGANAYDKMTDDPFNDASVLTGEVAKRDLIYIPNGTTHAVWNKGEVVAVSSINHKTTIKRIGLTKTPVIVVDQVLSPTHFLAMEKKLRRRTDFSQGHANGVFFPGKIAKLDRDIVVPLLEALASSEDVGKIYPGVIFNQQRDHVRGFASILCNKGWVHNDYKNTWYGDAVAPAAVFYFGFAGADEDSRTSTKKTGTAFYRDMKLASKQRTDGIGNVTASRADAARFEELRRVLAIANRLVVYSNDILRQDWVEDESHGKEIGKGDGNFGLPCSSQEGLLAVSLFFRSRRLGEGSKIMNVIDDTWRMKAMKILKGGVLNDSGGGGGSLEQTEETRRELNARRQLADECAAFVKGNAFNVLNNSCFLATTITVNDSEQLNIRGMNSLVHPALDRGGQENTEPSGEVTFWSTYSGDPPQKTTVARHFVMEGNSNMTLQNLKLTGAWVGNVDPGVKKCGHCQYTNGQCASSGCGGGQGPGSYGRCNGYTCYCKNNCKDDSKGGAIRINSEHSRVVLIDVIFALNVAYSGYWYPGGTGTFSAVPTGNIFSTTGAAKLYFVNMLAIPSEIVGITPELECNDGFILKSDNTGCIVEGSDPLPNGNGCCNTCGGWGCSCSRVDSLGGVADRYAAGGDAKDEVVAKYGSIEAWDVSRITDMRLIFHNNGCAQTFETMTYNISEWNVGLVTHTESMFNGCKSFNTDISKWDVRNMVNINHMFEFASAFNVDLSSWEINKVTTMVDLFESTSFNHVLCGDAWVDSTADQTNMFLGAGPIAKIGTAPCCKIGKALTIAYTYDNSAALDCDDHYSEIAKSGKYTINPGGVGAFDVYCDFDRNDGPWTVFQRRFDGSVDFYRNYKAYQDGFGTPDGEHWLGLDKIRRLSQLNSMVLRIDLCGNGGCSFARYETFSTGSSTDGYRLTVSDFNSSSTLAHVQMLLYHNGKQFSAKDKDQDTYSGNCATSGYGGWWYGSCHEVNLNGLYNVAGATAMSWEQGGENYPAYTFSQMAMSRNTKAKLLGYCADCPYGRYQDKRGFKGISCKECQDGYISNVDKSGCTVEGSDPILLNTTEKTEKSVFKQIYNSAAGGTWTTTYANGSTEVHTNGKAPTLENVKNSMQAIKSTMTPDSTWRFSPIAGTEFLFSGTECVSPGGEHILATTGSTVASCSALCQAKPGCQVFIVSIGTYCIEEIGVTSANDCIQDSNQYYDTYRVKPHGGSFGGTMEGVRCAEGFGAKCWFGESSMCLTGYSTNNPTEVVHAQISYGNVHANTLSCWDANGPLGNIGVPLGSGFMIDGIWVIRGNGATIGYTAFTFFGNTDTYKTLPGTAVGIEFFVNTSTLADIIDRYEAGGTLKETVLRKYGRIEHWNVQNVTNMAYAFYNRHQFNSDISKWTVDKVNNMDSMFRNASSFNIDLSSWNIGKVNTVQNMFYEATSFNKDLSPWSVDKVTTMGGMFYKATSYNHTLCGDAWVESTADQTNMFLGAGLKTTEGLAWSTQSQGAYWTRSGASKNIANLVAGSKSGTSSGMIYSQEITAMEWSARIKTIASTMTASRTVNPISLGICYDGTKQCKLECSNHGGPCDTDWTTATPYRLIARTPGGLGTWMDVGGTVDIKLNRWTGILEFCVGDVCLGPASCSGMTPAQLTGVRLCVGDGTGRANSVSLEIVELTRTLATPKIGTAPCSCKIGKFLTPGSPKTCHECSQGRYQDGRAFKGTSCKECQDGYKSNVDKSACIKLERGITSLTASPKSVDVRVIGKNTLRITIEPPENDGDLRIDIDTFMVSVVPLIPLKSNIGGVYLNPSATVSSDPTCIVDNPNYPWRLGNCYTLTWTANIKTPISSIYYRWFVDESSGRDQQDVLTWSIDGIQIAQAKNDVAGSNTIRVPFFNSGLLQWTYSSSNSNGGEHGGFAELKYWTNWREHNVNTAESGCTYSPDPCVCLLRCPSGKERHGDGSRCCEPSDPLNSTLCCDLGHCHNRPNSNLAPCVQGSGVANSLSIGLDAVNSHTEAMVISVATCTSLVCSRNSTTGKNFPPCSPGSKLINGFCWLICSAGQFVDLDTRIDPTCKNMTTAYCPAGQGFNSPSATDQLGLTGSTINDGTCSPCAPGTYKSTVSPTSCQVCLPGKYENETGSTLCKLCPAGKHLVAASTAQYHDALSDCKDCGFFQFNPFEGHAEACYLCLTAKSTGSSTCDGCNPGKYKAQTANKTDECLDCPTGYYSAQQNTPVCDECPYGYFANHIKSAQVEIRYDRCQPCPRGTFGIATKANNSLQGCSNCSSGRYTDDEGTGSAEITGEFCKPCPRGKWSDVAGMTKEANCKNCGAGLYSNKKASNSKDSCLSCFPGKYSQGVGQFSDEACLDCPKGYAQEMDGQAYCLPCISGRYNSKVGKLSCTNCDVGRASTVVARKNKCDACREGRYQTGPGTTACLKCIPGQYQLQEGQTTCIDCAVGRASTKENRTSECDACTKGRYQNEEQKTACLDCIPGKHQPQPQQTRCIDCDVNSFASTPTQTACTSCSSGQYSLATGSASCQPCGAGRFGVGCKKCPRGWYRSAEDTVLTQCEQCNEGETTGGATGAASCTSCDLGTFGNATRVCTECPANYFQDERKQLICKPCLNGKISNAKKTGCVKPEWKTAADCSPTVQYLNDTAADKMAWGCLPCPNGAYCSPYCTYRQIRARAGYWRVPWSEHNITFVKCLEETACLGASDSNNNSVEGCSALYNPPLCAACARGSYKDAASFKCLACYENESNSVWFLLLVVVGTLAVIAGFTVATVKDGGESSAVDVVILKIAVNSGIISAGASAFPLAWPPAVVTMFQAYAVASASAIGDSLSADCVLRASDMRPVQAWALTMAVIPPGVILLWAVMYGLMKAFSKNKENYLTHHLPVATIITLIFAHPVVTKSAVKLVACRTVSGRDFLDADFNISCNSEEYVSWTSAIAIPMFVLFTFGVPLVYAMAMYRHVRKGTLAERRDIYGFFFSGFRKEAWWFELWNTLRKSLFTISAVLFAPAGVMMQTWAALVLLLLYVVVFSLQRPYEESYLNHLERTALYINILTLLLGLGLFTNENADRDAKSDGFATFLTMCILGTNMCFVTTVFWTLSQHSQYCHLCKRKQNEQQQPPATLAIHPRRVHSVVRKHQPTIKGSLRYNAKVAVLYSRAKLNADKHLESRQVRLKARKAKQVQSRARLSDRLKQREKRLLNTGTPGTVQVTRRNKSWVSPMPSHEK